MTQRSERSAGVFGIGNKDDGLLAREKHFKDRCKVAVPNKLEQRQTLSLLHLCIQK
jgi:hypothetical protein